MRRFVLAPVLLLCSACIPTSTPPTTAGGGQQVSVRFYLVHEELREDLVERRVEQTGEPVFISTSPDLTEKDIGWATARLDTFKRRANVLVHFTPVGREKLATLTSQNIGKRLAIVVDGKLVSTPLIRAPIRDGRATIQGFRTPAEARRIAASLSGK